MCLDVRIVPSHGAILNSTKYSYSCRRGWLGVASGRRSCHKDGPKILMTLIHINLVYDNSTKQYFTTISAWHHEFDSDALIRINWV